MAAPKGGVEGKKRGKKPHKNKPTGKKYKHYDIQSGILKKGKSCPRCGAGVFLARHKNRFFCGKCHYAEFLEKAVQ